MNKSFNHLKVGDKVTRAYYAPSTIFKSQYWYNDGKVVKIENGIIICEILVDGYRTMKFYADTGISTLGEKYGQLV